MLSVIGGILLGQEQELDFVRTSNGQPVETVLNGYSGDSPGAPMLEIDVRNAAPQGGFEFDAGPYILAQTPVPFQIIGPGGLVMKGDCIIFKDNGAHGVNKAMVYSFQARAPFKNFK
jgi:hypothetical protein